MPQVNEPSIYTQIYALVEKIPEGKVVTYGDIAKQLQRCTPRMVGYALSSLHSDSTIPWQRVVNAKGETSPRKDGVGHCIQLLKLKEEGVPMNVNDTIALPLCRHCYNE